MKLSVAITSHNNRMVTKPNHAIIAEFVVNDLPNNSVFDAKLDAVKMCQSEWVLLVDSDDHIPDSFFDILSTIKLKDSILYCPEKPNPYSFEGYAQPYSIHKNSIRYFIDEGNFIAFMICGTYLFNRQRYIDACEQIQQTKIFRNDCMYLKYLWLKNDGEIEIVKGLEYNHNSQPDGIMSTYTTEIWNEVEPLKKMILSLEQH